MIIATDQAVRRLCVEHPEWLPVLEVAAELANTTALAGGEFTGSSVIEKLAQTASSSRIPNLRILVSYGLLEKSGPTTRGGRRAYYRMPDPAGVVNAIEAWRSQKGKGKPTVLHFVGIGASTEPPFDTARQAGDLTYEPRSWR